MKIYGKNPNFTILLPGACNASCDFCFWKSKVPESNARWFANLVKVCDSVPAEFTQCTVSGGEPTLSPVLDFAIEIIRERFKKVVFNTNGSNMEKIPFKYIDHLNVSRHHYEDGQNRMIFKCKDIAGKDDLSYGIEVANDAGVDVCLNCVVPEGFDDPFFFDQYLRMAKAVNASSVCYRKEIGNLNPIKYEERLKHVKDISSNGCPACRSVTKIVNGMHVTFKSSVSEPSSVIKDVYELILQQDGVLTSDWEGKKVIAVKTEKCKEETAKKSQSSSYEGGCGGSFASMRCGS